MINKEKVTEILTQAYFLEQLNLTQQELIYLVSVIYTFVPDDKLQEAIELSQEFKDYLKTNLNG